MLRMMIFLVTNNSTVRLRGPLLPPLMVARPDPALPDLSPRYDSTPLDEHTPGAGRVQSRKSRPSV